AAQRRRRRARSRDPGPRRGSAILPAGRRPGRDAERLYAGTVTAAGDGGHPMRQEFIDLYDAYTHDHLDRRRFMHQLAKLAGGTAAAAALVRAMEANHAAAAMIAPDDARVRGERVEVPS